MSVDINELIKGIEPLDIKDLMGARSIEAGYIWEVGEVKYDPDKNGQKVSLGYAPHMKIVNTILFEVNFPGVILTQLDGTSTKVASQGITRRMKKQGIEDFEAMKLAIINSFKGIRTRVPSVVVRESIKVQGVGGILYDSIEAAREASVIALQAKGFTDEQIEAILETYNLAVVEESEEVTE